jgi:hypothetical protein
MEEKICSLFCPLNDIVDQLYGEWTKNISLRIKQHSLISDLFKEYLKRNNP